MYTAVLLLHSWLRWAALITCLLALARAASDAGSERSEKAGLFFMIAMDLQMLLGILLYAYLSPTTEAILRDFGGAMRDPIARFWAVEHLTAMVLAVVFAHLGRILARKAKTPAAKRTRLLVCFGLSLLLMLAGIPWTFSRPGRRSGSPLQSLPR
jgi:heme A synthase